MTEGAMRIRAARNGEISGSECTLLVASGFVGVPYLVHDREHVGILQIAAHICDPDGMGASLQWRDARPQDLK